MRNIEVIRDEDWAMEKTSGTSLGGFIDGYTYTQLVEVLGEPTFDEPSGDDKTQVEWVFEFEGEYYTMYDWKTYDPIYTKTELTRWNIGSKGSALNFIDALETELKKVCQN